MKKLALLFFLAAAEIVRAAELGDTKVSQIANVSPIAYKDVIVTAAPNGLIGYDAAKVAQVKTLIAGTGIGITNAGNTITIDALAAQETLTATVKNAEATTLTKGQIVYLYSATGGTPSVKLAYNTSDATSAKTFGMVSSDTISANGTGIVTCVGVVSGLNLGTYNDGDTLYLGASPGTFTATKPYAPNHLVYVGIIERANAGNGSVYVKVQNGYELDEIHDVQINNPRLAGQTLIYDATNSLWKNARITAGTNISVTNADSAITIGFSGTLPVANGGTGVTTSTGTGSVVLSNSPTLVTPNIGAATSTGLTLSANTALYLTDATLSNYSATNGVYLNGNIGGWLALGGDGARSTQIRLHGSSNANANIIEVTATGGTKLVSTTASTSTTTGALVVSGGAGIAGNVNAGGNLTVNGSGPHTLAGTLNINPTSGDVQQNFQRSGTGKGILAVPAAAGSIVADSAIDDFVVRTTSGKAFRVTTDGGNTSALAINSSTANFTGKITTTAISGINALAGGTQLATFESSVNGAAVELITKGKNSLGTARQANIGLNRFADDVLSISDGTTERLRLGLTSGNLTVNGATSIFGGNNSGSQIRLTGDSGATAFGYTWYSGTDYEASMRHVATTGVLTLDVGRSSSWGGKFDIYLDTTRAARFTKTSTILDGNLLVGTTTDNSATFAVNRGGVAPASSGSTSTAALRAVDVSNDLALDIGVNAASSPYPGWIQVHGRTNQATNYPLTLNPNGGNVLVGTTVDSGAKLQIGTNTTGNAGGVQFGTDLGLWRSGATTLTIGNGTGSGGMRFIGLNADPYIQGVAGSGYVQFLSAGGLILGGDTTFSGAITGPTLAPGLNTPAHYFSAFGANSGWPMRLSTIYDVNYVDQYITLNGTLTGTRAAPTFTGSGGGGGYVRASGPGGILYLGTFTSGAGATPVPAATFTGGNTTLAGSLGVNGTTASTSTTTGALTVAGGVGVAGAVNVGGSVTASGAASLFTGSNSTSISDVDTTAALISKGSGTPRLYFGNDNAANRPFVQAGVGGGALFMILQPYGGNVLVGGLTDNSNGRVQLANHTASTGGIGFGSDTSLYRAAAQSLNLDGASTPQFSLSVSGTQKARFESYTDDLYISTLTAGKSIILRSGNAASNTLTLASDQSATFIGTIATTTNAAKNAVVARYNPSNSLFGITVNSAGQGAVAENADASSGSDKYSKTGLPAFRMGNVGGSGTIPFWVDVAAAGTAGNAITWTNALKIDASANTTLAGTLTAVGVSAFKRSDDTGVIRMVPTSGVSAGSDIESYNNAGSAWARLNIRSEFFQVFTGANGNTLTATFSGFDNSTTLQGNLLVNGSKFEMTANGAYSQLVGTGTAQKFFRAQNTGGDLYVGVETSVAGSFFPGSGAYNSVWYSPNNYSYFKTPIATFSGTTASTSTTTGALVVGGGAGIAGAIYAGGNVTSPDHIFGTSGPSAKSSIAARAARQGLVFDGTAGGTIANAATIGTADFTIAVWMNLRSTAGSQFILTNSIGTSNFQTSVTDLVMYRSTGSTIATNTNPLVTNKTQLVVYTRSGTTGQFYVNGIAFEGTKTDANSYTTFSDIGGVGSSSPLNGTLVPFVYNRALSAAEVAALYEAGVPSGADYNNASNTSLLTGANSDFSSAGNWSVQGATTISGGKLNLSNGDAAYNGLAPLTVGKRYRLTITVDSLTAGLVQYYNGSTYVAFASSPGTYTVDFTCAATFAPGLHVRSSGGNAVLDTALYYPLGLLLAPDAAQAGGGPTWYDTSGNAANITLPASGVSWSVPSSQKLGGNWTVAGNLTTGLGTTYVVSALNRGTTAQSGLVQWQTAGASNWSIGSGATGTNTNLEFYNHNTASTNLLLNYSTGNVLVGTTTDWGGKLQVYKGNGGNVNGAANAAIYLPVDESNIQGPGANTVIRMGGNLVLGANSTWLAQTNGTTAVTITSGQQVQVNSTTTSTSTTTGALVVSGGMGVAGNGYFGGNIVANGSAYLTNRIEMSAATGANSAVTKIIPAGWNGLAHRYGVQSSGDTTQISVNAAMTATGTGTLDDTSQGAGVLNLTSSLFQFAVAGAGTNPRSFSNAFQVTSAGDATLAGTATATQYKTASGTTGSIGSGSATTILSLSGKSGQMYLVHASLVGINDATSYAAYATVVMDGTSARIVSNNATYMTITLSGTNVQATQTSGVSQQIAWKYTSL